MWHGWTASLNADQRIRRTTDSYLLVKAKIPSGFPRDYLKILKMYRKVNPLRGYLKGEPGLAGGLSS